MGTGHLAFKVKKKTFAYYVFHHHGDDRVALECKAGPGENRRLVEDDPARFYIPPYIGAKGWVGVRLDQARIEWPEIEYLVRAAYRLVAPAKLAAAVE